jgi:glycosyltransferase involved in cell wall biosynthesis
MELNVTDKDKKNKLGVHQKYPASPNRLYESGRRVFGGNVTYENSVPLVTVITVVYNNEKTLKRCIDSVIRQNYKNIEYIVIDGASTDGTLDIIKRNISHIDYALSEKDNGIYHAMNKGLSLAKGDFVALINSDDWLEPDGIRDSMDAIIASQADVLIGYANVWDRKNNFSHIWKIGNFDSRILLSGMSFCHQAVIASRRAYESTFFYDEKMAISSDYKWVKELYLSNLKSVFLEKAIVNFSFDGISANNRPIWKEECKQMLCNMFPNLSYSDVSRFLEYIYRDGKIDKNSILNLVTSMEENPLFLKSMSLVLLDKLVTKENNHEHPVAARTRCIKPKISVVIPVYNVQNYISECLISVMSQSLKEIEIIVVDDGSPDDSVQIVKEFQKFDPRIRLVQKENGGLSSARNRGVVESIGEYVHFLDSDDYINAGMYESLYSHAKKHDLDIVKSNLGFIDNVYPTKKPTLPPQVVFAFVDCPNYIEFISPCAALYKREFLATLQLFPLGITYEDRPFNWESILKAERIGHVDVVYYMYRVARPDSIMNSNKSSEKHFDAFECVDIIASYARSNDCKIVNKEYLKEQLRLYTMLIDISAIPANLIKKFFDMCSARIIPLQFDLDFVTSLPINIKHKIFFEYLIERSNNSPRLELDKCIKQYKELKLYTKLQGNFEYDSCDLFNFAISKIKMKITNDSIMSVFKSSLCKLVMFDFIHTQSGDISFSEIENKLEGLFAILELDKFSNFVKSILSQNIPIHDSPTGLVYTNSEQINYLKVTSFITRAIGENTFSVRKVVIEDLPKLRAELSNDDAKNYKVLVEILKGINVKESTFSHLVQSAIYIKKTLDLSQLKIFYVLFPYSPFEVFLNNLKELFGFKTIFVPHGLPQKSFTRDSYDYVFAVTNQISIWKRLYPESIICHLGWSEVMPSGVEKKFNQIKPIYGRMKNRKKITFLSQLSGFQIHKLDDIKVITEAFLAWASLQSDYHVNIRLRNDSEKSLIDRDLLQKLNANDLIIFTTMKESNLEDENTELLISISSTGLLYAQTKAIPSLQIVTEKILDIWPFNIAAHSCIYCEKVNFDKVIFDAISSNKVKYNYAKYSPELVANVTKSILKYC